MTLAAGDGETPSQATPVIEGKVLASGPVQARKGRAGSREPVQAAKGRAPTRSRAKPRTSIVHPRAPRAHLRAERVASGAGARFDAPDRREPGSHRRHRR
jgi:hypothetical protein